MAPTNIETINFLGEYQIYSMESVTNQYISRVRSMSENANIFTHKIPVNIFRVCRKSKFLFILYSNESHRRKTSTRLINSVLNHMSSYVIPLF